MAILCSTLWLGLPLTSADGATPTAATADPELRRLLSEALAAGPGFGDRFDAEVWLVDMSGRLSRWLDDPAERDAILEAVYREASRTRLDPLLVLALIHVESRYERFAVSRAGARGLMQIMPFWLDEIGSPDANLFHIDTNLRMGCTILRHYLDRERGNLFRALGRYNGSLGKARYPNKVFAAKRRHWYAQ